MGLVKCPDCEKMVSERVEVCPFCGCPAEFFAQNVQIPSASSGSVKEITEKIQIADEKKIAFRFKEEVIEYPAGTENFAKIYGMFSCHALEIYFKYSERFDKCNITEILGKVAMEVEQDIDDTIDKCVEYLYSKNVRITKKQFIQKYSQKYDLNFREEIRELYDKRDSILEEGELREQQRELEKASRSRWQGGGFGLSGALKGAATAGMLNLGSDMLHSFGDASRASRDRNIISGKLNDIGNSEHSKNLFVMSAFKCIKEVYYAFSDELVENNIITKTIKVDMKRAMSLRESIENYEKDPYKFFAGMIECIGLYPDGIVFYEKIFDKLHDSDCDYDKFIQFWHIGPLFEHLEEDRNEWLIEENDSDSS